MAYLRQRARRALPILLRKTQVLQRALSARRITTRLWAAPASRTARAMLPRTVLVLLAAGLVRVHQSRRVRMELFQTGLYHILLMQTVDGSSLAMIQYLLGSLSWT